MAGTGRGRDMGRKSPKKPAKSLPPERRLLLILLLTPPHLPSDDASSHHDEELDISSSPAPVRSPSASQTSRPSSPVSSIAGDGKGPGEGVNKLKTPLFQMYFVSAIHFYVIFFVIGGKKKSKMGAIGYQILTFTRLT